MAGLFKVLAATLLVAVALSMKIEKDDEGEVWVVLVAGSNSWFNYRHQADVCHAYQILKNHGIDDDHIVVMMYDDIAQSPSNPHPGVIINRPDGPNVYAGVPKDYVRHQVTPHNFLKVLSGEDMTGIGSGKTIKSGPNDRIFVNLVDHGAPGIFGFPTSFLHARALNHTIAKMHENKQFKEMVIYLEACESGSMFKNLLPDNINVYAATASNEKKSSFACYYDKEIHNFLGDVFSIKWMEDSDKEDLTKETLMQQFNIVKNETTTSPVQKFGELSIMNETVGTYQGMKKSDITFPPFHDACMNSTISSPDVPVGILSQKVIESNSQVELNAAKEELNQLKKNREFVNRIVQTIVLKVTENVDLTNQITDENNVPEINDWNCYETTVDLFHKKCFNLGMNPYAMRHVKVFSSLCEEKYSIEEMKKAINSVCTYPEVINIH